MISMPQNIPASPGIYIFFGRGRVPLYIGKAADLKKRLSSYFQKNIAGKIKHLLEEATSLKWVATSSEIEALLKEAELIKRYRPKYNYLLRDDKNYFYVAITQETYPRIFITHQPASHLDSSFSDNRKKSVRLKFKGPFTSGSALKSVLKMLRKIFPYCTCKKPHPRPCLNSELGRCAGYCCIKANTEQTKIRQQGRMPIENKKVYQKNIQNIIAVLCGKKKRILIDLRRAMQEAAKRQDFEKAAKLRDQIGWLENIFSHRPFLQIQPPVKNFAGSKTSASWFKLEKQIRRLLKIKKPILRVEGYDISNISGKEASGSMVVFTEGQPDKSQYRKFRIKTVRGANDLAMLKEVIRRRLVHSEWSYPDLILVDGGKAQLNAVLAELLSCQPGNSIAVAALAKRQEELYFPKWEKPKRLFTLGKDTALFFQRVRDEAHRFAKKYHHKLREIAYRKK